MRRAERGHKRIRFAGTPAECGGFALKRIHYRRRYVPPFLYLGYSRAYISFLAWISLYSPKQTDKKCHISSYVDGLKKLGYFVIRFILRGVVRHAKEEENGRTVG